VRVGRNRVARLMRGARLAGVCRRRRRVVCTRRDPAAVPAPDLVDRQFVADRPDELWVAHVTYVPTLAGWLYLTVVLDVYSRRGGNVAG
jgi:putative transposase